MLLKTPEEKDDDEETLKHLPEWVRILKKAMEKRNDAQDRGRK
jgi:hypothetical protein